MKNSIFRKLESGPGSLGLGNNIILDLVILVILTLNILRNVGMIGIINKRERVTWAGSRQHLFLFYECYICLLYASLNLNSRLPQHPMGAIAFPAVGVVPSALHGKNTQYKAVSLVWPTVPVSLKLILLG